MEEIIKDGTDRSISATRLVLVTLSALLLTALLMKVLPKPFVWLGWGWALGLFASVRYFRAPWARALIFNAAVLIAVFAATETYLGFHEHERPTYSDAYFVDDDVLGTAPAKQTQAHSTSFDHGKLIYDVTYTIGPDGLRIPPPSNAATLRASVLFFGCSFTFGEGLQDNETIPYQVGMQSAERYRTYNFGFHGYGPNQMLASIESGRVRQIVDTPPQFAIYQALPDHVARAAGKITYGKHNPRYQLDADGTAQLNGHFDDGQKPPSIFEIKLKGQLGKSAIYRTIESREPRINDNDVHLLLAIVKKSRDLLVAEYPGIEFHVILWRNFDEEQPLYHELQEGLAQMNIPVHLVENILPDYNTAPQQYWLGPDDRHPNALADRVIANYVVTQILSRNPEVQHAK